MFENILHAPLQRHSGVSPAAHSLLEGLLERDVSKRLGGSRDLVSWKKWQQRTTQHTDWSASNFSVFPGGAAGTFFLWIYKLDWPPRQESFTPLHPERGKYHPLEKGQLLSYQFISTVCLFIPRLLFFRRAPATLATLTQSSHCNPFQPPSMRGARLAQPATPSKDSPSWTLWSMWFRNIKSPENMFPEMFFPITYLIIYF